MIIINVNYLLMMVDKTINLILQKNKKDCFHKLTPLVVVSLFKRKKY